MRNTTWAWVTPGAFLAAALLAGCGGGGGGGGGGGDNGGGGGGGGTTPGAVVLTTTPGHGFVTLNWTQPNSSGVTYTIQRALGNGSFENLPSANGGSPASTSATTYQDASYNALSGPLSNGTSGQTLSFPLVGSTYIYKVIPSAGTASGTATATPYGPGVGISLNGSTSTTTSPAPFTNSASHVYMTYALPAGDPAHPVITMHFVFDYAVTTTADVDRITVDVAGDPGASGAITYSHAQIAAGLSRPSGTTKEIDFTSAGLSLSPAIPAASAYSLVLLNAYVTTSDNVSNPLTSAVPFQFCYYLPGTSNSVTLPEPGLSYASQFVYTLTNQ